jgi:glyoxylase-like metal-dependent hydrolase (beta-lactamase superfamily II)
MRAIDLRHVGRERVICCWQVEDMLIDPGPSTGLPALLEALGQWRPRIIALTHIHLDHAGATGTLARRWPEVEVRVHERGARHLVDPAKLLSSASRLYGADMDRLWGEVLPVPAERVVALTGEESWAGWRLAATPGHASHHVAYLHESTGRAFCGDVAGVRIPPSDFVLAPTPPPDIDLEAWERSLQIVERWEPTSLALTHFGSVDDVGEQLAGVRRRLRDWGDLARDHDRAEFMERLRAQVRAASDPETAALYELAAPADQLWQGLRRYWERHAAVDSASGGIE